MLAYVNIRNFYTFSSKICSDSILFMRLLYVVLFSTKVTNIMPKKSTKPVQDKLETIQAGPITVDKSGGIAIKINAKPGAKNNNITGRYLKLLE